MPLIVMRHGKTHISIRQLAMSARLVIHALHDISELWLHSAWEIDWVTRAIKESPVIQRGEYGESVKGCGFAHEICQYQNINKISSQKGTVRERNSHRHKRNL
jgi:hypothetical protein